MKSLWRVYYWTKAGRRTTIGRAYSFSLFYGKKKFFDREIFPFKRKVDKELFIDSIVSDLDKEREKQNKRRAKARKRRQEVERLKQEQREREAELQREIARRKKVKKKKVKKVKKKKVKKVKKKVKRVVTREEVALAEELIDEMTTKELDHDLIEELSDEEIELLEKVSDPVKSEEIEEVIEEPKVITISKDETLRTVKRVKKIQTYSSEYEKEYIEKTIQSKTLGLLDATILNFTLTTPLQINELTNKEYVYQVLHDNFDKHLMDFYEKHNSPSARYIFRIKYQEHFSLRGREYTKIKGFSEVRTPKNLTEEQYLDAMDRVIQYFSIDKIREYLIHHRSEYFLIDGFVLEVIYA